MKWLAVLPLLLLTGLALPAAAQTGNWTAEYYDNTELAGNPVVIRSELGPRGSWGLGSPHTGVPANHFAARWSTRVLLEEGEYQISVEADDGVRVQINDLPVVDAWRATDGEFFQVLLPLPAGEHQVVVEYLEQEGPANLIFNMDPLLPPPPDNAARARVTARFLNMRNEAGLHGDVVGLVSMNQVLPVVGRNGLGTWLQLEFGERRAWVNARYVAAENLVNLPVTEGIAGWVSSAWITVLPELEAVPVIDDSRETPLEEGEDGEASGDDGAGQEADPAST